MSDIDAGFGQSSLATLNMSYNNPRMPSVQPINANRRPSRSSYRPAMNPPPTTALPAPPTPSSQSSSPVQQYSQPLRLQDLAASSISHPYSAQSFASTPEWNQEMEDGFSSGNERQQRLVYRQQKPQSGGTSQTQGFNPNTRQPSTSSLNSHIDQQYPHPSTNAMERASGAISPGSYFAAYPPAGPAPTRDRADSGALGVSAGSSSHTASASGMPSIQGLVPTHPPHTHSAAQSISTTVSSAPTHQTHSSTSQHTSHRTRPSSRRALTAALELAKSAVQLDATSDDPHGAVLAYAKSVQLLSEVMERVMRGEDASVNSTGAASSGGNSNSAGETEERRRGGRRRSVVAKEEEVRRLKAIHDTYADRMKILCLIYSIPDPLSSSHATALSAASSLLLSDRHAQSALSSGVPPRLAPPMASSAESLVETLPETPEDPHTDDAYLRDPDSVTIKKGHQPNEPSQDWEVDSEWERRGLTRDRPRNRERDYDPTSTAHTYQSPVSEEAISTIPSGAPARPPYPGPPRSMSQDAITPITGSIPISLSGLRNSALPPPRPPPSGPLPNRPRLPSGANIPPQLLNQPLPPLPPAPKLQNVAEPSTQYVPPPTSQPLSHTITRQSSSSSVSATSGVSSTASGSSAASHLQSQNANHNSLPISNASLSTSNPLSSTSVGRPRGNSNAHMRNPSNADRLGALNEEREEEERPPLPNASTTPPQEYRYRSRSSSMVSLKDRDRAKAQVLGANSTLPPVPPTPATNPSPASTPTTSIPPILRKKTPEIPPSDRVPSPAVPIFGSKATPRPRGSSVGSSVTHLSDDYINSGGSPVTTPMPDTLPYTAGGIPPPTSAPIVIPGSLGSSDGEIKINSNTSAGTISQRRQKNSLTGPTTPGSTNAPLPPLPQSATTGSKLTSAVLSASTAASLGLAGRNRAASNPGKWPTGMVHTSMGEPTPRPPMPPPPMSAGPRRQFPMSSTARYQPFGLPSPGASANASTASLVGGNTIGVAIAGMPASAPPPAPPALSVLRPYHLMSLLRKTMVDRTGGYVTPRLHVPHEVWTQGSAKLTNSAEKTKVVDVLVSALDELANASVEFCGSATGIPASTPSKGDRKQSERWAGKLEEFERSFRVIGESFGKKLGAGEGFVVKKNVGVSAWSSKMFDKISAVGKQYESPIAYASLLARFFVQAQLLDEHTRALHMSPQPPSYASLPQDIRMRMEDTLKNISELFAKVVLTFVFRDLSIMLDKYHKTCDKWIQSNPGTQA